MTSGPIDDVLDGLESFLVREVDSLHSGNRWLADPRLVFDANGHHSPRALELIAQVRTRSAAAGYYAMVLPSDVGGSDLGFEGMFLAWERLFRHCGSVRWLGHHALAHWTKGPSPLLRHATPAAREAVLGPLTAGETTMCLAMSEPEAGSDSWSLATRARRVPGGWSLTGTKAWISNGVGADHAVVIGITHDATFAARKGGVGAFLVHTGAPGFAIAGVSPMFGSLGSDEATVTLDEVFVPDDHVLGDPGGGFAIAMEGVGFGKVYNCAKATGLATWALHSSLEHVKIRRTFGRPLAEHQSIAFGLADSATGIHAARLVALDAARRLDAGQGARKELAMAKVLATDAALAAIDRAVQSHGAMGFTNELGLAKAWQTVRILGIADGTNEILRRQIAQDLLKGDVAL